MTPRQSARLSLFVLLSIGGYAVAADDSRDGGGTTPRTDDSMDGGGRTASGTAVEEVGLRQATAWMQEVEQRREQLPEQRPRAASGDAKDGGGTTPRTEEVGLRREQQPGATSGTVAGTAADDVRAWLQKMHEAAHRLDYEGTFVYQHDTQLEALRIVHKVEKGAVRERLVSLNGAAREIIRNEREVLCYLPDENSVVVEKRRTDSKTFPAILPDRLAELGDYYSMQLGRRERIAGRPAQQLGIQPRDGYRYGYRLWADVESGLLLKADLMSDKGKVLEQFMFTHIRVGAVPAAALEPENPGKGMVWYREGGETARTEPARSWAAARLPKGFKLTRQVWRTVPMRQKKVEHLVYSDGLATVSVFVEQIEPNAKSGMEGPSRMGAVHAYVTRADGHQVTVVGEVPAETVAQIAMSVAPGR